MTPQQAFQRALGASKKYTEDTVVGMGAIKGDKGDKGDAGEISVGTVTSGTSASVTNSGTKTNAVFDFVLPKGDKGDTSTIAIGSVTSGTTPSVINRGTNNDAILDFVLEKGDKGDTGITAQIFTGTDITGDVDVIVDVATSNVGDLYINTDTSNLYKRTDKLGTTNLWEKVGNIEGKEGDDAYEVAVAEGFIGTRAEWLESLHGEATNSYIVWEKPSLSDDTTEMKAWYYYKVDGEDYGSGSAWLNRFNVPTTQDYPAGDFAFYSGINYLCFSCNTPIPALTQKDTTQFYVLYDEKNKQCQAHFVEIATGTDTSLNWTDVTVSDSVPSGYLEVRPDVGVIQYGKWVQTIYLGNSKANAYDCTITTGANVSGFITSETFSSIIGNLGLLTTTDKTNLVSAINGVNGKFSGYVAKTDIVDSLTSTDSTKPLSANQGKELEGKKIDKASIATSISSSSTNDNPVGAKAVYDLVQKIMTDTLKKQNPIGKLYITTDDTNPATILGFGTWVRVAQNMTLWGANENGQSGSTKSAGLPNITGNTFCDLNVSGTETSGAFYGEQSSLMNGLSTGGVLAGVGVSTGTAKFDASRSSKIYGNSTTVQPPALVVNIWKRTA